MLMIFESGYNGGGRKGPVHRGWQCFECDGA